MISALQCLGKHKVFLSRLYKEKEIHGTDESEKVAMDIMVTWFKNFA
jgi:hypothetical protein